MKYLLILLLSVLVACKSDPKPKEVWLYEHVGKDENPFSPEFGKIQLIQYYDSVIDVKDGWVEWVFVGKTNKFYSTIEDFKLEANKIR